jgi:hypothetical protein
MLMAKNNNGTKIRIDEPERIEFDILSPMPLGSSFNR